VGVYRHLGEIAGTGYHSPESFEGLFRKTLEEVGRIETFGNTSGVRLDQRTTLLPLLIAAVKTEKVSVLDFGGGMGMSYIDCLRSIDMSDVRYTVVDLKAVQERGKEIFCGKYQVEFSDHIPHGESADIVYIGGSLQYVEDYRSVVCRLMDLGPKYILMTDIPLGKGQTYATAQVNMRGRRIPCWIFEENEILRLMEKRDYRLTYRAENNLVLHFGDVGDELRIEHLSNLLFVRGGKSVSGTGAIGRAEGGCDAGARG
jgi:putative methyltransferase (TIGR04325 family)